MQTLNQQFQLPGPPDEALRRFAAAATGIRGVTVTSAAPGQVVIDDQWHPWWTIVLAVVFFPFGLLALLITSKETVIVTALPSGDNTVATVTGRARPGLCRHVLGVVRVTEPTTS